MSTNRIHRPFSSSQPSPELEDAYPLRLLNTSGTMSTGRSSPAPSYHSQTETGFAAFRSRNPRSRFSRFGQNNARESDEQQGLLQDSDDEAAGRASASKRPSLISRQSEDHRRQYGTHGIRTASHRHQLAKAHNQAREDPASLLHCSHRRSAHLATSAEPSASVTRIASAQSTQPTSSATRSTTSSLSFPRSSTSSSSSSSTFTSFSWH